MTGWRRAVAQVARMARTVEQWLPAVEYCEMRAEEANQLAERMRIRSDEALHRGNERRASELLENAVVADREAVAWGHRAEDPGRAMLAYPRVQVAMFTEETTT